MTTLNDAVHWSAELGGGTRIALIQAGRFRSDAGALLGVVPRMMWKGLVADEIDADHRLLQALNCLLVETSAGRVLVETGIGDRIGDKGRGSCPLSRPRALTPPRSTPSWSATSITTMPAASFGRMGRWPSLAPSSWLSARSGRSPWTSTRV